MIKTVLTALVVVGIALVSGMMVADARGGGRGPGFAGPGGPASVGGPTWHGSNPPGFSRGRKAGWVGGKPPGWSKGKKKGWGGRSVPPGLR